MDLESSGCVRCIKDVSYIQLLRGADKPEVRATHRRTESRILRRRSRSCRARAWCRWSGLRTELLVLVQYSSRPLIPPAEFVIREARDGGGGRTRRGDESGSGKGRRGAPKGVVLLMTSANATYPLSALLDAVSGCDEHRAKGGERTVDVERARLGERDGAACGSLAGDSERLAGKHGFGWAESTKGQERGEEGWLRPLARLRLGGSPCRECESTLAGLVDALTLAASADVVPFPDGLSSRLASPRHLGRGR